jgi:prepilin-type N-terminal cleavage/methylation domain-containing protein
MLYNMDRRAGFTLIELLITIIIMVTLVTLAVVNLRSNQIAGRDEKRKTDISTIAQQLEAYYSSGSDPVSSYPPGEYPPTEFMNNEANIQAALRDLDPKTLRAPDIGTSLPISLTVAANTTAPDPDTNTYVYMPLTSTGTLCQTSAEECRKFVLYYKLEAGGGVQTKVSKNQ